MLKVIKETKQITIEGLISRLEDKENLIVFYRSGNKRDGIPCFLQHFGKFHFFASPMFDYTRSFESDSLKDCLSSASQVRDLYVLTKDEATKLFKLEPIS